MCERKLLGYLGLALVFLIAASACDIRMNAVESKPEKVILFAVDGLESRIVEKLLDEGRLPVMKRLVENGSVNTINCVAGMVSPAVWTTVATGVMPGEHGITGFVVDDVPVTSTVRKVPAFWNMLARCNLNAATVGWMVTWPAEEGSGIVISDRAHWGSFEDKIKPDAAIELAGYQHARNKRKIDLSRFTDFHFDTGYESFSEDDPEYAAHFLVDRRLIDPLVRDTIYKNMSVELLETYDPEVLAVYFQGVDFTSHGFWQWYDSKPFEQAGWSIDHDLEQRLGEVIPLYYEYVDGLIGQVLEAVEGDPLVILLSDHGFAPRADLTVPVTGEKIPGKKANLGDYISGNHRDRAVLILSGPEVASNVEPIETITHLDILPTFLYSLGIKPPEALPGRVLHEFYRKGFRPASFKEVPYLTAEIAGAPSPLKSEHDSAILEDLRSLGYVE